MSDWPADGSFCEGSPSPTKIRQSGREVTWLLNKSLGFTRPGVVRLVNVAEPLQ